MPIFLDEHQRFKAALNSYSPRPHYERQLGDTEASYYLQSRLPSDDTTLSGINDMYLYLGFTGDPAKVTKARLGLIWAILRVSHPLLAAKVVMRDYHDIRFVYAPPLSVAEALLDGERNVEWRFGNKHALVDSYLNGPRTLSEDRLSCLLLSEDHKISGSAHRQYHLLIAAAHFIGDAMAMNRTANDIFTRLGSRTDKELLNELEKAIAHYSTNGHDILPRALENRLPVSKGRFEQVAQRIAFQKSQEKLIGGHSLPRHSTGKRHTVESTVSFDVERTKAILKACKVNGVSISAALFALCSVAWARSSTQKKDLPIMMYSALNIRPYLQTLPTESPSYWHISISHFNVVLPSYIAENPSLARQMFWLRARQTKKQVYQVAKNPLLVSYVAQMAEARGSRARAWAKEDDEKERGTFKPSPVQPQLVIRPPANALIGLSLLGNVDDAYSWNEFGDIRLNALSICPRQRPGASLLFSYTFCDKLWLSFCYDRNGLEKETLEKFWNNLLGGIDEMF